MAEEERRGSHARRPSMPVSLGTAPGRIMAANGHFASVGGGQQGFEKGIQVINEDGMFNENLTSYLQHEKVIPAGFNYHLISVFGSQSTGKSTLLNYLFGTSFGVMNEEERKQTTKGIWMSKNKKQRSATVNGNSTLSRPNAMAENILVMDVEGTDGRERGEDQDFERKSALFALATSEILIVNIWEHQVGLYQGANMGLLKTVFEVNLQLFVKDSKSIPRSVLFFVIRDHIGTTPLKNLQETLLSDLVRIWSTISKPQGLENSKIEDYFDFAFAALPHKILQPERFEAEVGKLGARFREGYKDPKKIGLVDESDMPLLLPEYHRRIPADGFSVYAMGIWEQIMNNKDLDLPTQQELLAQFRCDEIAREVMIDFEEAISPLELKQSESAKSGNPIVIISLGQKMNQARTKVIEGFQANASRYHKGVYTRKKAELESSIDSRLNGLFQGQLSAAHKAGIKLFSSAVSDAVKADQRKGAQYDFAEVVTGQKKKACDGFESTAKSSQVPNTAFSEYTPQFNLFKKELDEVSKRLRVEEIRRLANRVERWVKSSLAESVGLEFNKLGSGRSGSGAPEFGQKPASEADHWDRVWALFTETVQQAETKFSDRAKTFNASPDEVEAGLWRLRRKSWSVLRGKIDEEIGEGNLGMKLRENFEDRFRYDEHGVPRIWRPTDDIDGLFAQARDHTLTLIPLLARFRLSATSSPPPLDAWIGSPPVMDSAATPLDDDDLPPIGGVDQSEPSTLDDETLLLSEPRKQALTQRFRRAADAVYVEAKRGALGGVTATPWWMWGLLLVLGQNEIFAVARNPLLIVLLAMMLAGAYVTYQLNLWGPMIRMARGAWDQGVEVGREKLREFLENSDRGREAMRMGMEGRGQARKGEDIGLEELDKGGKRTEAKSVAEENDGW